MRKYHRILLKLSGEALASENNSIEPKTLDKVAEIVKSVLDLDIEIAIVIGGGNIFRGKALVQKGINRVTGDHMGMLATVINALALADNFSKHQIKNVVMSGFAIGGGVCEEFNHTRAKHLLSQKTVTIFSAGTGSPCFTTDTGATLRAIEIGADAVFKATKVDGVYSSDPLKNPQASRYKSLSFDEAISKNLQIMDTAAFAMCRENGVEICVFSMLDDNNTLLEILNGKPLGTIIS